MQRLRSTAAMLSTSVLVAALAGHALADETVRLDRIPHIHGIEVSRISPGRLYLATHHGLFLASPNGTAEKVSDTPDDFMGFAAHPSQANVFFASGHPPAGGNLGVMRSTDGGKTWSRIADGVEGPVDFHAMDISKADPNVVYGTHEGLQVSRDGGKTWTLQGELPGRTFDLSTSTIRADIVYAATMTGLKATGDAGATWQSVHVSGRPATMVQVTGDGTVYAFIAGDGLVKAKEPSLVWQTVGDGFGANVLLHLATDPADPDRLFAVADTGGVVTSNDGGRTWIGYEGSDKAVPDRIARGQDLYVENCQSCHGIEGGGEPAANISKGVNPAPALDDTAHAWHHSDSDLVLSILEGFEKQGGRMPGWKDTLSREDAENIVAYFKTLWDFRSYACQGARHMACGAHGQRK